MCSDAQARSERARRRLDERRESTVPGARAPPIPKTSASALAVLSALRLEGGYELRS